MYIKSERFVITELTVDVFKHVHWEENLRLDII